MHNINDFMFKNNHEDVLAEAVIQANKYTDFFESFICFTDGNLSGKRTRFRYKT